MRRYRSRPVLADDEAVPVERRRTHQQAVEQVAEALRHLEALAAAGRAAGPVVAVGLGAVIPAREVERPGGLRVDAILDEILDLPLQQLVLGVEDEAAACQAAVR